jgi:hypothetical protein
LSDTHVEHVAQIGDEFLVRAEPLAGAECTTATDPYRTVAAFSADRRPLLAGIT